MFGSIAGAESVLLAFDDHHGVKVAMAEARTAPSLQRRDPANPDGDAAGLRLRAIRPALGFS